VALTFFAGARLEAVVVFFVEVALALPAKAFLGAALALVAGAALALAGAALDLVGTALVFGLGLVAGADLALVAAVFLTVLEGGFEF
jgi:hypothetical protein